MARLTATGWQGLTLVHFSAQPSSTFQLNLSRFLSWTPPTDTEFPQNVLTLSRKVDECKALPAGRYDEVLGGAWGGAGKGLHSSSFQINLSRF